MVTNPVPTDGLGPAEGKPLQAKLADLPEPVRARVVVLAADALPQVTPLPAALRRVAEFAPARRARLGGSAIAAAFDDDEVRERVATQVAARPARDGDLVDAAARAWLSQAEGWTEAVEQAGGEQAARNGDQRDTAGVDRLREKVAAAEQAAREARSKAKAQVDDYKSENATLRRKLGEARTAERLAREAAAASESVAEDARRRVEALEAAQDKDIRRLRARVEQLEADLASYRRTSRADRDDVTMRARLLLDTVVDAAAGLRRELALPAVPGAPGDRVEAALAEPVDETRTPTAAGALGPASPALLEQLLAMPRARLLVDGYNVSKTAWGSSSLEAQRQRLLRGLAPVVARTGAETTVVFDAGRVTSRPVVAAPRGVKVVFSPVGVIADDVIRDLVAAEPQGRPVVVVSDDQEVARDARAAGARSVSSEALVALLARG
jgi:predicted RNA-binding protein with PIN domain